MSLLFLAMLLGFVQAITEFLPISSSGHLILIKEFLHINGDIFNLSFDIILHFGTLVALIVFFRKELKEVIVSIFKKSSSKKLLYAFLLATIPAVLIGPIANKIEDSLRSVLVVASMLALVGALFIIVENISKKTRGFNEINLKDAIVIGIVQTLAFIPGVSRSGITIAAALFLGLKREEAAKFSFLISIPIVFLISVKDIYDLSKTNVSSLFLGPYVAGFIVSAITGFLVIKFLLSFFKKYTLKPFAYYRFILALTVLIFLLK